MNLILIMIVGVIVGYKFFNEKYSGINSMIQLICITILIFSMGVSLGSRPNFFSELSSIGIKSFVLSAIPIIFSIIFVYILTKKILVKKDSDNK